MADHRGINAAIGTVSLPRQPGRLVRPVQLGHEGVGGVEFLDVPEPLDKAEERVRPYRSGRPSSKGGPRRSGGSSPSSNVGRGPMWAMPLHRVAGRVVAPIDMDSIDAGARAELIVLRPERGWRSESPGCRPRASPWTTRPGPLGPGPARAGAVAVALGETLADFGAGDGEFILDVRGDVGHVESVASPHSRSRSTSPSRPAPNRWSWPTTTVVQPSPRTRTSRTKSVRTKPGERPVERLDDKVVEPGSARDCPPAGPGSGASPARCRHQTGP